MRLMRCAPASTIVAFALAAAVLAAGCGASSIADQETATEAQAAQAPVTVTVTAPPENPDDIQVTLQADGAVQEVAAADNGAAWASVDAGAQGFAAQIDRATQSIASCETDAAAGADFAACASRAYEDSATAATNLGGVIDGVLNSADGECRASLVVMRNATTALIDDYANAAKTTDWTSLDTLKAKLGDDAQAYADTALAAAAACAS